jgi:hypothetical protein
VTEPPAIAYVPICVVRTPYARLDGMPLQTAAATEVDATVELGTLATRSPRAAAERVHSVRSDDRYGA